MKKITIKTFLIIGIVAFCFSTTNAQLSSLKNKVKSKTEDKLDKTSDTKTNTSSGRETSTSTNTSSSSSDKPASDAPKYNPDDDIYNAYSSAQSAIKSVKSTMSNTGWEEKNNYDNSEVSKDLAKVKTKLDFLKTKSQDSKKYYKNLESDYTEYSASFESKIKTYKAKSDYSKYFSTQSNLTGNLATQGVSINSMRYIGSYKKYEEMKKEYLASGTTNETINKNITKLDDFYTNYVPNTFVPYALKDVNKITESAFNDNVWKDNPSTKVLTEGIKDIDSTYMKFCKDESKLTELKTKLVARKDVLEKYVSSGDFDKYKAAKALKRKNEIRLVAGGLKDASVNTLVTSSIDKSTYGTIQRVVITSDTWIVEKNDLGIPTSKHIWVDFATKKTDGKCYINTVMVERTYEGGGSYGAMFVNMYQIQNNEEMNCENVFK